MNNKNPRLLCLLGLFVASLNAQAAIVYQSDGRYTSHSLIPSTSSTPSAPYADFTNETWGWEAGTYQNSALTDSTMSGSGSTYVGPDGANHYGASTVSTFYVEFGVDQLTNFSLNGTLDTNWWDSSLYVSLTENGTSIFALDSWNLPVSGVNPFSLAGQFSVGNTYGLTLHSSSFMSDYYNETWAFDLQTSAVPVPAAVWLFGSGLIGLMGVARRKARA